MAQTKLVNGKRIPLTLDEIQQRQQEEDAWQQKQDFYVANEKYRDDRKVNYPNIGDQLDAILKQLNYMQLSKQTNLVDDMDTVVNQWLAVKKKYPKMD